MFSIISIRTSAAVASSQASTVRIPDAMDVVVNLLVRVLKMNVIVANAFEMLEAVCLCKFHLSRAMISIALIIKHVS
jgi:hypothetical protein